MPSAQILHATQLSFPPYWKTEWHSHADFHEVIVIISGAIETQTKAGVLVGRTGSVLVYPRSASHAERSLTSQGLRMLYIGFTGPLSHGEASVREFSDGRCTALARWIIDDTASGASGRAPAVEALGLLLAYYNRPAERALPAEIERVQTFVRDRLSRPLTLNALAEAAGCSPFHFARQFAAATGVPPMRYVRRMRVETARTLLLTTAMPLRAIAPLVGLSDERELIRVFKRETGMTPGQLRK